MPDNPCFEAALPVPSQAGLRAPHERLPLWMQALADLPRQPQHLMPWIEGPLRQFFGFQRLFCAHGELIAGEIHLTHWLASGHDPTYLNQLATSFELRHRGSLAWWLANRQPFSIDPARPPVHASRFELDEIRAFDLGNVAAHGTLNRKASAGVYCSFSGMRPLEPWHDDALRLVTPTLSDLFLSLVVLHRGEAEPAAAGPAMTPRQAAIVRLVAQGLDNKRIGSQLDISEKTVRNQLTQVFAKFGVERRTQLIERIR